MDMLERHQLNGEWKLVLFASFAAFVKAKLFRKRISETEQCFQGCPALKKKESTLTAKTTKTIY
ncbi:CLUMA_CG012747, isoform A [Clunio marinus]|uniref:CLUMA_CG012747, isoform A n=1 Tax=Clunio marinus TaxID=568069 RepID=A0A1J1IIG5_9DIPT|nr:CLUMA_CG012747, isoform A [Clunio marinus]